LEILIHFKHEFRPPELFLINESAEIANKEENAVGVILLLSIRKST